MLNLNAYLFYGILELPTESVYDVEWVILQLGAIMPLIKNLKDKLISARNQKANKIDFKNQLLHIVSDGFISDAELEQINLLAQAYDIQEVDLRSMNAEIYRHAFNAILSDGIITEAEDRNIHEIANILQVENSQILNELTIIERHRRLRLIQQGVFPVLYINGIVLTTNEIAHFIVPAKIIEERVINQGYQGSSSGVSIRVAKGVSFKVGQSRGRLIKETGVVPVDAGDVILTNKRVLYKGQRKSFSFAFSDLMGYQIYTDGMDFVPNKGKPVQLAIDCVYDSDAFLLMLAMLIANRT